MNQSKHRVANLAFVKLDFEIRAFFNALVFFENLAGLFSNRKGLGPGKTLSKLHIHYKYIFARAWCKEYCKISLLP